MTLSEQERADFVGGYTRALINAWSIEEFAAKLDEDPKAALTEVGIAIPDDAEVRVDRDVAGSSAGHGGGSLEDQVHLYEEGQASGVYRFSIPADAQIGTRSFITRSVMARQPMLTRLPWMKMSVPGRRAPRRRSLAFG